MGAMSEQKDDALCHLRQLGGAAEACCLPAQEIRLSNEGAVCDQ